MKHLKFIFVGLIIVAGASYFFLRTRTVMVAKVVTGPAIETIYATGTVESTSMVPVRPKVSARIEKIITQEGQSVKKGTILAELDALDIRAKVKELQALTDFYKLELDRAQTLLNQKVGSVQARDKAKSTFLNAEAILTGAKIELDEYNIASPADCKVIRQDGEIGELVGTEYDLFWLDCSGKYRITAEVDEEDINLVKIGQRAILKYEGDENKVYEGAVASITPKGDEESRVFRVRISVDQDLPFMLGMSTEVNIITGIEEDKPLIPSAAISDNSVWVVTKDDRLEKRPVTIGIVGDKKTEIVTGLKPNEIIATQVQPWFKDGLKVEAIIDKSGRKRR